MITFSQEAYGTYARASYCADFLEIATLLGNNIRWGDYDDFLTNNGVRLRNAFLDPDENDNSARRDDLRLVEIVKEVIEERADILRERYPFQVLRGGIAAQENAWRTVYSGILSLCQLHAANDRETLNPELAFEVSVHAALEATGLLAAHFGTGSLSRGFSRSLQAAAASLGLAASDRAVTRPRMAQDDGVDHIACFPFNDPRSGQWTLIGQTTCARSNDWRKKSHEPVRYAWSRYLSTIPHPQKFLAIPHHAETATLAFLLDHAEETFIIDRLRICLMREATTSEELAATGRIQELGVEVIL